MARKHPPRLLFAAAIASIILNAMSAFAATPGLWVGMGEFGTVELVVNSAGTGIEKVTYKFSSFQCGIVTSNLTIIQFKDPPFPISGSAFGFTINVGSNMSMALSGTFNSATAASGTWEALFEGVTCTGSWATSGGAVNEPPVANTDGPGGSFQISAGGKVTLAATKMSANDIDAEDGSPPGGSVTITGTAAGLSVMDNGNQTFTFTHDGRNQAKTTFTYTIKDSNGAASNTATVSLTVNVVAQGDTLVINKYLSASWYNANQNGHGFSIEVLDDNTVLIYWYAYTPSGHSMFLLGVGHVEGNLVIADTYIYQGMIWGEFDSADLEEIYWGEMILEFHDCQNATLTYSSVVTYGGEPFGSGNIPLTRLGSIDHMQCNNNMHAGIYEGSFRSDITGDLHLGTVLLSSDGEFVAFSFQDVVVFGTYTVSGQDFNASGTAISADPDVYFSSGASAFGEIQADHRLVFDYDISGGESGFGNGWSASSLYRRGMSFGSISGNWNTDALISNEQGSVTINSGGGVTGSDDLGCTYTGQITIPDLQFNMLEITVTVANCGDGNGTYSGLGYQTDAFDLGDGKLMRIYVGNGIGASVVELWR